MVLTATDEQDKGGEKKYREVENCFHLHWFGYSTPTASSLPVEEELTCLSLFVGPGWVTCKNF